MRNCPALLVSLSLVYLTTGCNPSDKKESYNLDVEELTITKRLPVDWGLDNIVGEGMPEDSTLQAFSADSVVKQHGRYSLCMDWRASYGVWTCCSYAINKRFKGKTIKLTGYLKTENTDSGAGLWMRIDGTDGQFLQFDNMQDRKVKGTTDWKKYTVELPYDGEHSSGIVVGALTFGPGKVWMDNLQITIDGKDITVAPAFDPKEKYKAERDTAFNESSGIKSIVATEGNIRALTNLGMIWGFLKYHHEAVCHGEYNMDAELFRVIPKVLAAKDNNEANVVLEEWVDGFGEHPACTQCDSTSGRAKLRPDYATLFAPGNLPATLQKKLAFIRDNRHKRDESYYVGMYSVGSPRFQHENSFAKTVYPDAGVRLLALYRYWNMILYFFPDRHLMGENWSEVLATFIPAFCSSNDAREYENTCIKLVGRIHDTHANVWGGGGYADGLKGKFYLPVEAKFIEGKLVVTDVFEQPGEKIFYKGDIIEQIDNEDVDSLVAKNLPLTPGSNIESQLRDLASVNGSLMRSYKNGISVSLLHNGQKKTTPVRLLPPASIREAMKSRMQPAYRILPGNIGCIYPASLQESDFEKIKDTFRNTRGIVIDMRCYPNDFMTFTYGGWFKAQPSPFVLFTKGRVATPGRFDYSEPLENGDDSTEHYKGRLVILVNEQTQSSAEYQTMALQSTPGAKVVGSTTAGADGNVTPIKLPGGLTTMFSGIGILYPDSTETQRKGVRIDKEVKPTIKGIKDGRDEVLDEALRMIRG